jgi:spore coat protein CotH
VRAIPVLLVLLLVAAACGSGSGSGSDADLIDPGGTGEANSQSTERPILGGGASGGEAVVPENDWVMPAQTPNPNFATGSADYLFDDTTVHTFDLQLAPEALAVLDDDPTAEQYVEGALEFEGETVAPVGIRYKGSVGAFVGCLSGGNPMSPSGSKTCTKLSMKVKINWSDSGQEFFGQRKLQFHSMNLDASQMRERLGYSLFRAMGVAAPRSVHARVLINGEFNGIYALTEQIDGRFVRANFDDGTGNLYKEVWPLSETGEPTSEAVLRAALETNEDDDPSVGLMHTFGTELAAAKDDTALKAVIEKWVNIDELMAYAAVDRTIRHDDGPFHWYCFGPCNNHNYFWYEDPTAAKLHLIPWDLDNAFENIEFNANPVTPVVDGWGETSNSCEPFTPPGSFAAQRSAACDRLFAGMALFNDDYQAKVDELVAGPMSADAVAERLDTWTALIEPATQEASEAHRDARQVLTWLNAADQLESSLDTARRLP